MAGWLTRPLKGQRPNYAIDPHNVLSSKTKPRSSYSEKSCRNVNVGNKANNIFVPHTSTSKKVNKSETQGTQNGH